jgi:hypothetical protein
LGENLWGQFLYTFNKRKKKLWKLFKHDKKKQVINIFFLNIEKINKIKVEKNIFVYRITYYHLKVKWTSHACLGSGDIFKLGNHMTVNGK